MSKKLFAEFFGTFWLVFGGCGSAIFAASVNLGIGYVGVAFAFGLTVLTMAYACLLYTSTSILAKPPRILPIAPL